MTEPWLDELCQAKQAEIDRLRARLNDFTDPKTPGMVSVGLLNVERETSDRLRAAMELAERCHWEHAMQWKAEIDRLRAENEKMKRALEEIKGGTFSWQARAIASNALFATHAEGPNAAPEC